MIQKNQGLRNSCKEVQSSQIKKFNQCTNVENYRAVPLRLKIQFFCRIFKKCFFRFSSAKWNKINNFFKISEKYHLLKISQSTWLHAYMIDGNFKKNSFGVYQESAFGGQNSKFGGFTCLRLLYCWSFKKNCSSVNFSILSPNWWFS